MSLAAFLSAVLALLIAPGPTNTLMGLAGARQGAAYMVRLLPAELLGYLTTILPLVWFGAEVVSRSPATATALKVVAACWVMFLAVRLWRKPEAGVRETAVTARKIYVTTMLNPKALVFGLVLLPTPGEPEFGLRLALFCLSVSMVALGWGMMGAATRRNGQQGSRILVLQRIASVWLGVISLSLGYKVMTG